MVNKFDSFLVGEGSAKLVANPDSDFYANQVQQLFANSSVKSFIIENDLNRFSDRKYARSTRKVEELFLKSKKEAYEVFDFINTKSKYFGDAPIRERDLIVTEEDRYIVEYLKKRRLSVVLYKGLANLLAYREMGIELAKYVTQCTCPVCSIFNGKIFSVEYLISLFSSGEYLTHASNFSFFPVILREYYQGPIEKLSINITQNGIDIIGLPIEFSGVSIEVGDDVCRVEFVNLLDVLKDEDSSGVVVYLDKGVLNIHNSYVGNYGPMDFLNMWLSKGESTGVDLEILKTCEPFFLGGRKVVEYNGSYWDLETGKVVK